MNSTPLLCKVLRKALWKFKVKMKSAWIQHEFNTNVMQNVAQSVVKLQGKNEISMNSAWFQHEFDMNSTPASPQPNLHQNLGKNLQFKTKSQNHWKCMNSAGIWHESDMNGNIMLHVWICMNSAWIQHEFNMKTPCCSPNIYWNCQIFPDFLRRFGLAVAAIARHPYAEWTHYIHMSYDFVCHSHNIYTLFT